MPKTGENIYKRKDGRWEARFISGRKPDGCAKYTSVYARTYAAAKAKLEDRKRMIVSRPAGSCRLTVKELFVWYLSQAEIKPSTRARYVFLIEHHILPELGSIFVVSLTAKQLSDFLSQKRQSGRLHGGGLSAKSVRDIGVLIKAALRFASAEYGAVSQEHRVCSEISKCVIAGIGCIFAAAAGGAAAYPRQDRNNWRRFY